MPPKQILNTFITMVGLASISTPTIIYSETFLTVQQAQKIFWKDMRMTKIPVTLTKKQMKSIAKASKVRVRNQSLKVWKTSDVCEISCVFTCLNHSANFMVNRHLSFYYSTTDEKEKNTKDE